MNKLRSKLFLVLTLSCLFGFAQPRWVKQSPTDNDYYIGVGSAKKSESNYVDKARDVALARLASNIAVNISSETNQQVLEQAGMISKTFESNVSSFAKAQIEGYEIVEKWENKKEYWVYYHLSKAEYKQIMMQKQMIAKKEASQYFKLGKNALNAGETITALTFFAKAGNSIGCFRGMGIRNLNEDMGSYLDVDVFVELNKILAALQLKSNPTFIKTNKYASFFKSVSIEASLLDNSGKMVAFEALPIAVQIPENKLEYGFVQPTNSAGKTTFNIKKVHASGNIQVKLLPNIWALAGVDSENVFYDAFAGLSLPTAVITINVSQPNVYIESIGSETSNPINAVKAKQKTTELGWVVTDFDDMADFILQVNTQTRQGMEMQGIYTAFASGSVALIKNSTGDEIFRKTLAEINGGGGSFELAKKKALENLSNSLIEEVEQMIIQMSK